MRPIVISVIYLLLFETAVRLSCRMMRAIMCSFVYVNFGTKGAIDLGTKESGELCTVCVLYNQLQYYEPGNVRLRPEHTIFAKG